MKFAGILPVQGTEFASHYDSFYYFLIGLSVFFFLIVVGAMVYFANRFRQSRNPTPSYIEGNDLLEFIWTAVPTVLVMVIFVWGYRVYREQTEPPANAYEIRVIAKQWLWQFQYDNGKS